MLRRQGPVFHALVTLFACLALMVPISVEAQLALQCPVEDTKGFAVFLNPVSPLYSDARWWPARGNVR